MSATPIADAFNPGALGRHFDTVLDSAFLHILGAPGDADRRRAYAAQLALVLPAGGTFWQILSSPSDKDRAPAHARVVTGRPWYSSRAP